MAVTWGSARTTSTNGVRVGIDLTYSVSGATATVVMELWVWTRRASFTSSASYSRGGTFGSGSGSFSYNHSSNSSDWPTSNRTRIGRWTTTRTLQYGSTQTVTATGSVSGLGGNMPSGSTSHSRSITLRARPYVRPNAPTGVSWSRNSDTSHTVSWSRNATTAGPYGSQRVQRRMYSKNGWSGWVTRATVSGTATSWTDRGTTANRAYQWRVVAVNTAGSRTSSASTIARTTPWVPSAVSARAVAAGIRVSFTNNVQYGAHSHSIQYEINGDGIWRVGTTLPGAISHHWTTRTWTFTGTNPANTYRFAVRSQTTEGPLRQSAWVYGNTVRLAAPPAAPTGLGPSSAWDASEDRVLSWRHVPTDDTDQEQFQVRHRLQGTSTWTTVAAADSEASQWTLPAGTYENGDVVDWQVRTWGVHPDPGPWSATNQQRPQARPTVAINAPEDGETLAFSSVTVEWGFDQEQGSKQSSWRWELLRDGQTDREGSGAGDRSSVEFTGLDNHADYLVRVWVRSAHGLWSDPDEVAFATDFIPPPTPSVEMSWDVGLGAAVAQITVPPPSEGEVVRRTNLVANPSFETGLAGVTGDVVSRSTNPAYAAVGTASLLLTNPDGGFVSNLFGQQLVDVPPDSEGWWLGFSASTMLVDEDGFEAVTVEVQWLNAAGNVVPGVTVVRDGWWLTTEHERHTVAAQAPAGATTARVRMRPAGIPGSPIRPGAAGQCATDAWIACLADTEGAARTQVAEYFDGATQGSQHVVYAWTGPAHASPSTEVEQTTTEAEYVQLWRAIDDGPWVLVADEVPLDTAVTDPIPAIGDGRVNYYRARAVSALPSTADSAAVALAVSTRQTRGWVYLNGGEGMAEVCRVRANAERSGTRGRARTRRQFAGRTRPVSYSGTATSNEWDVKARVAPNPDGGSTDDELVYMQEEYGDLLCYRDPTGKRWFASMDPVDDTARTIVGEVSWSMTEVDHVEGLAQEGLAVVGAAEDEDEGEGGEG